jgi:fimbrial chaperone protein
LGFGPPTLALTARNHVGTVSLTNRGADAVRFEVKVLRWEQQLDGRMKLEPTDDAIVFPQLLTIAGRDTRRLRVSMTVPPGEREKTYRIQVTEIPQFAGSSTTRGGAITMLSQLQLPIFYAPVSTHAGSAIAGVGVHRSALTFSVANTGTVHFITKAVTVTALGAGGRVVFSRALDGWYVLPGGQRDYRVALPNCGAIRAVTITAETDAHPQQTIDVPADACRS